MTVCANCESPQGPFVRYSGYGAKEHNTIPAVCANTRADADRVAKCIKRRERLDIARYGAPRRSVEEEVSPSSN